MAKRTKIHSADIVTRVEINRRLYVGLDEVNKMVEYGALEINDDKMSEFLRDSSRLCMRLPIVRA